MLFSLRKLRAILEVCLNSVLCFVFIDVIFLFSGCKCVEETKQLKTQKKFKNLRNRKGEGIIEKKRNIQMYITVDLNRLSYEYLFAEKGDMVNVGSDIPYQIENTKFIRIYEKGSLTEIEGSPYVLDLTNKNEAEILRLMSSKNAVKMIRLDKNSLKTGFLNRLKNIRGLFALSIDLRKINKIQLTNLKDYTERIKALYLYGGGCGKTCRELLKKMKSLRLLHLKNIKNTNNLIEAVDSPMLENLSIDFEPNAKSMKTICGFSNLKRLDIYSLKRIHGDLIRCNDGMIALKIRRGGMDYKQIENIMSLRELDVGDKYPLVSLNKKIVSIRVKHDTNCYNDIGNAVKTIDRLRGLFVYQSSCFFNTKTLAKKTKWLQAFVGVSIHGLDYGFLRATNELRILDLSMSLVNDKDIVEMNSSGVLRHLDVLVVSDNEISDIGAIEIGMNRELRYLNISSNKLTNKGVRKLAGLKKLQVLDLGMNKVSKGVARVIGNMKMLEALSLRNTDIVDKDLELLEKLENLKILVVTGSKVTKKGIARIRKNIPDLKVFY